MKALKIIFILIAIAFVGVFGYYQIKNNSDNIHFKNPFGEDKMKEDIVFQLSSIESTLRHGWYSQDRNTGELTVSFIVENISAQPQSLYPQNIGVFDCKDQRFAPSLNLYSKVNPLLGYDEINPKTKKKFTLIFEVPINEVYYVGYTDNIESIGKQSFIDNIRQRSYKFETFEDMETSYNNGSFEDISKPKYREKEVLAPVVIKIEEEENPQKSDEEEKRQAEQARINKERELQN